jgi:uncharacterized protein (TIGR03435 family)
MTSVYRVAKVVLAFRAAAGALSLNAQPPASNLKFEVASVKQNKSEDFRNIGMREMPGGKISYANVPLHILIGIAYDVPFQSSRLTGGPDWIRRERYDIEAAAPEGAIPPQATARERDMILRSMLQNLLAERFQLVIHGETKELPVYAVIIGKRGLKLEKSGIEERDCAAGGETKGAVSCHSFDGGQGRGLHSGASTINDAAQFVSNWTDRPMIDETNLPGLYKFDTPGWVPMQPRSDASPQSPEGLSDPLRPSLFAIFEQMGLKLESKKAPVVIFHIESVQHLAVN